MISGESFLVRASSLQQNKYYVDYIGLYKLNDISIRTGINTPDLAAIYKKNNGIYDEQHEVFFFDDMECAKKTITEIMIHIKSDNRGRAILLTEAEIEYIRQALINEGANSIHLRNKIKDNIFKKLNS